jgi:hypothetical protein
VQPASPRRSRTRSGVLRRGSAREQGAVEALDDAIRLRPLHASLAMLNALELEEQLVGMAIGPAAELAAVAHCEHAR